MNSDSDRAGPLLSEPHLLQLAEDALRRLADAGAEAATVRAECSVSIQADRGGAPGRRETGPSQSLAARVFDRGRNADASVDLQQPDAIDELQRKIAAALEAADEHDVSSVPTSMDRPPIPDDLQLFDPALADLTMDEADALAEQCASAARAHDPRVDVPMLFVNRRIERIAIASSAGARGVFTGTVAGQLAMCIPRGAPGAEPPVGMDGCSVRRRADLLDPVMLGQRAAALAVDAIGGIDGRTIASTIVPVVFESHIASVLTRTFAVWLTGDSLCERSRRFLERVGTSIAGPTFTLIDDPLVPAAADSRPFDADGLPSRRNVLVERGKLVSFLLDVYSANRLGLEPTASARGTDVLGRRAQCTNLVVASGDASLESIIAAVPHGLYVTYARVGQSDASTGTLPLRLWGRWIEHGALTDAVSDVKASTTLDELLLAIDAVANDRPPIGGWLSPSFRVAEMRLGENADRR